MPDLDTSLSYCTYCPKLCRHACPVSSAEPREPLVPQAKMSAMARLRGIGLTAPEAAGESEALYGCTGCGACTEACAHGIEVGPALFTGRAEAERAGRGHPALADFVSRFQAWSAELAGAQRSLASADAAERPPTETAAGSTAWFPGCEGAELTALALRLFRQAGSPVALVDTTRACAGYPLLAAGQPEAFRVHAEEVARQLADFERVIVHCPACLWTLRTQYAAFGAPIAPRVEHSSEALAPLLDQLPPPRPRGPAFYHDPCYLGRQLGIYDAPRRLAERAIDGLREFSRARAESECSGGGGLLPITMPAVADAIAERRLVEVHEAGLDTVVTACSTCRRRLTRQGIRALDVLELFADGALALCSSP